MDNLEAYDDDDVYWPSVCSGVVQISILHCLTDQQTFVAYRFIEIFIAYQLITAAML